MAATLSDRAALLAAMRASPDDAVLPLICADVLESEGREDLALLARGEWPERKPGESFGKQHARCRRAPRPKPARDFGATAKALAEAVLAGDEGAAFALADLIVELAPGRVAGE